ncbi:DEAD/DEAH box helicase [Nocardioides sp. AN3]
MTHEPLAAGLYESLVTSELRAALTNAEHVELGEVDSADAPHVLARHVYEIAQRRLRDVRDHDKRLALVNRLLVELGEPTEALESPASQLLRIAPPVGPGAPSYGDTRPSTPLADAALLTNAHGEPNLGGELRAEMDTADEVDLLCAFVKWHGLRLLEPELRRLRTRRAPLRVITTTYVGATERRALDRLVREFGAEVKVQYDAQRTRLHAKAWMFGRASGFDTAYVGSSNLSKAALLDGVEWNVRLSRVGTPSLLAKFAATFDTYWNDSSYELYDPDRDGDRLDDALAEASGRLSVDRVTVSLSGLEVRPYPYQQEMLDALDAERVVHGRRRNLVVAATGTGKTVVAALDYRRLCDEATGARPRLLFVAHRQEILRQSLRTYREVLNDASFGELYVDGTRPERWEHVFASVQSLSSYGVDEIPPDAFDVVVIDEFHHAAASSYRRLLDHLQPRELLGLTATPERADGVNVRDAFFDGRIATELRLWDALGADLLCPFHYFAVGDNTDLSRLSWTSGRYDGAELSNLYTADDARARIILRELADKVLDPGAMRALGFCVDVAHADYMTRIFNDAGLRARTVTGQTPSAERAQIIADLRERRVNIVFTVDVFNEGLDVPSVDTVLFLRPTESATIFLQQLGRGLRRTHDKAVLTVLDFVGLQHKKFRWDLKLRALTGLTRAGVEREIKRGFPFLPSGSQIVMDEHAQAVVLDNIRSQVASRWSQIVAELRAYGDMELPTFLREAALELSDVVRGDRSWTRLRRDAGLPTRTGSARESQLLKRNRAVAHVDDERRAAAYISMLSGDRSYDDLSPVEQRLTQMLFFSLWPDGGGHDSYDAGWSALRAEHAARAELSGIVDFSFDAARQRSIALGGSLASVPLRVHARYQREEILAAIGYASLERRPTSMMQGVAYAPDTNIDAFFITIKKSEAAFSPTTMYRDYPISPTLFHWESQSTTTTASPTGQRYINGTSTVMLFVREQEKDDLGTAPYLFLGPAQHQSHAGERPIAITWRLEHAMPMEFVQAASLAAG